MVAMWPDGSDQLFPCSIRYGYFVTFIDDQRARRHAGHSEVERVLVSRRSSADARRLGGVVVAAERMECRVTAERNDANEVKQRQDPVMQYRLGSAQVWLHIEPLTML